MSLAQASAARLHAAGAARRVWHALEGDIVTIFNERRAFGRRTTFSRAWIVASDGAMLEVGIIDLGEGGARLQFAQGIAPPAAFVLMSKALDLQVACTLVHTTDGTCGVKFTGAPGRLSWQRRRQDANDSATRRSYAEHLRKSIKLEQS